MRSKLVKKGELTRIPVDPQEPVSGAVIGTNVPEQVISTGGSRVGSKVPSKTLPLMWKYQLMAFRLLPVQSNAGVYP